MKEMEEDLLPARRKPILAGLPPGTKALDFLASIYRDSAQPIDRRMRAAIAALPYESPKLSINAQLNGFADKIEAQPRRSARAIGFIETLNAGKGGRTLPRGEHYRGEQGGCERAPRKEHFFERSNNPNAGAVIPGGGLGRRSVPEKAGPSWARQKKPESRV
jgi:hypothetical protein